MAKINILESHLAELIAAGEVVERPSSVVKELTENAIDAGATAVTVEIKNGGITYIRVTDNGCGIAREDVPLAFLRHATSKITKEDDLNAIGTLGFRGEALASICAMARVEMLTRTESDLAGTRYRIDGGAEVGLEDAGCPRGTTIVVRDLFYNTPARLKFLKKDVAEGNAIAGVLDKMALSHPEIAIRLLRDGREVLRSPGDGKLHSAVFAVYGREFTQGLIPVSYRMGEIRVAGYVSRPAAARASRNMQTFFINGRYVKSQTASAAVERACQGAVMAGKFPACVLQLTIPAEAVDVNVHPAKIEVRFIAERPIFDAVYRAICDALSAGDRPKELEIGMPNGRRPVSPPDRLPDASGLYTPVIPPDRPQMTVHDGTDDYLIHVPVLHTRDLARQIAQNKSIVSPVAPLKTPPEPESSAPVEVRVPVSDAAPPEASPEPESSAPVEVHTSVSDAALPEAPPEPEPSAPVEVHTSVSDAAPLKTPPDPESSAPVGVHTSVSDAAPPEASPEPEPLLPVHMPLRFVGELFATYILLEAKDEMILIDKHAAHERILYEKLKRDTAQRFAQQLLTPVVIHPPREEAAILLEHAAELHEAGFDVEEFGGGALVVRSAPMSFADQDVENELTEIAAHLLEHRTELTTAHDDWILHNVACRAAIKAGDGNDAQELMALAQQLYDHPELRYCPHGRPIYLSMKRRDLEKQFGRTN